MAEYSEVPEIVITDTFSTLVTDFNTVSSGLGATGDLTTNVKTTIVGAINEIEGVFDASAFGISAGSTAFDITTTNASGISLAAPITSLTGNLSVVDNKEIRVGTGDDLILLHDATNSIIKGDSIYIKAKSADENMASFTYNGAVNLYHDAASRLATTAGGVSIPDDLELGAASVIKSGGNAAITFANANVTMGGNISIAGTVDGRDVSVDGTKLDTVETNADVTDTANVTAAGALMDSELADSASVKALNQSLVSGATPTFGTANFTDATNKRLMTDAQETKLDSVETSADVTDTANVTSAGALMDSELASIADVKALDQSVVSGATPTFGTANFTDATDKRFMSDAQESKLDGIAAGAQVNRNAADTLTLIKGVDGAGSGLDADLLDGQPSTNYATAASVTTNSSAIGTIGGLDSDISADGNLVVAINELQGDIRQINANGATANNTIIGTLAQLNTDAKNTIVDAINEIEDFFNASAKQISGGSDAFTIVSGNFTVNSSGDINLDADGADINLKDNNVTFGSFRNSGGNLIVKSGTTTALTFSGADVVPAGNVDGRDIAADGTKLDGIAVGADVTSAASVVNALIEGTNITIANNGTISSTDTNTEYTTATSSTLGLVKIGYTLNGKNYPVELSSGKMFVNVPWDIDTDTNTQNTYDVSAVSVSGGAQLRLGGSGPTATAADNVKLASGGATTVSQTDPSTITISSTNTNTQLSNEQVQDIVGGMLGGTNTGITITYQDGTGDIDFVVASQTDNNFTNTLKSKLDGIESNLNAFVEPSQALTTTATTVADAINELKLAIPLVFNASGTQLN